MTPTEPTPEERRRAAEWLRERAEKLVSEARKYPLSYCGVALLDAAHGLREAATAYERGEQP